MVSWHFCIISVIVVRVRVCVAPSLHGLLLPSDGAIGLALLSVSGPNKLFYHSLLQDLLEILEADTNGIMSPLPQEVSGDLHGAAPLLLDIIYEGVNILCCPKALSVVHRTNKSQIQI